MAKFPMTPRGQQALREELKRLREVERPKNVRDIEEARGHGDLKENADYHAAKERRASSRGARATSSPSWPWPRSSTRRSCRAARSCSAPPSS